MKFIRVLKASEEKWAVYLRGEKISPTFNSKEDAIEWAERCGMTKQIFRQTSP